MVSCHSRKRVATTTGKASKSQCKQKQGSDQSELRQLVLRDAFASNGCLTSQTRINVENNHDGAGVHNPPVNRQRLDPVRNVGRIKDVACRSESYQTLEAGVGTAHVADLDTEADSLDGGQKGQPHDHGSGQGPTPSPRSYPAIPSMECQEQMPGALKGEEPADGGSSCQVGTDSRILGASRHSAEVSFIEETTNGEGTDAGPTAIHCDSLDDDPLESDSPEYMAGPATVKLKLYLASYSMQLETSRTVLKSCFVSYGLDLGFGAWVLVLVVLVLLVLAVLPVPVLVVLVPVTGAGGAGTAGAAAAPADDAGACAGAGAGACADAAGARAGAGAGACADAAGAGAGAGAAAEVVLCSTGVVLCSTEWYFVVQSSTGVVLE